MGQIKLMGALLFTILFSIALLSYAFNFGEDNDVAFKLGDEERFSTLNSTLITRMDEHREETNKSSEAFFKSETAPAQDSTKTGGAFKQILQLPKMLFAILKVVRTEIFGNSGGFGIIFTGLVSFITFMIIVYAYKLWAGRNPD